MAPEVIKSKEYTKKVDIFSVGIIMYSLLTGGKHPVYEHSDSTKSFTNKITNLKEFGEESTSCLSFICKSLFSQLTKFDSYSRYSASEALEHPWITRNLFD